MGYFCDVLYPTYGTEISTVSRARYADLPVDCLTEGHLQKVGCVCRRLTIISRFSVAYCCTGHIISFCELLLEPLWTVFIVEQLKRNTCSIICPAAVVNAQGNLFAANDFLNFFVYTNNLMMVVILQVRCTTYNRLVWNTSQFCVHSV